VGLSHEGTSLHEPPNYDSHNVSVPQTTPDGRILPVPIFQVPTTNTPSTMDEARVHHFNNSGIAFPTQADVTLANQFTVMAPPPKRPSIVTPLSSGTTVSTFQFVREGTRLFQPQKLANSVDENTFSPSSPHSESDSHAIGNQNANDENPVVVEGVDTPDPNEITFVDQHQQFTSTIQLLQDQDVQYQDILLEGTMKLNIATSMLLQVKCDMYDLTDQILDELDSVQEYMQDFLPVVESD
jgi:hypothetical protein